MDLLYTVVVALVLAVDAFVVSISCGMAHSKTDWRFCGKVSIFFGIAQASFFCIGYLFGFALDTLIPRIGHWIAFILLLAIGSKMIIETIKDWKKGRECRLIRNRTLIFLSIATSIDALAIGVTFAVLQNPVIVPMLIIGSVTIMLSFIGVVIGDGLKGKFDKYAEITSGFVLILLALRVLIENIL